MLFWGSALSIILHGLLWSQQAAATPVPQVVADKPEDAGLPRTPRVVNAQLVKIFKYWSEWTAATYCVPQQGKPGSKVFCEKYGTCQTVHESNTTVLHTWIDAGLSGATGFVGLDHTTKSVVITMRGSVTLENWITDLKYWLLDCSETTGIPGAQCETGFYNSWEDSKQKGALTAMNDAIKQHPDYAIVVTGHSLGGAAALIGASELRKTHKNVTAYTYGQPRVGNLAFSEGVTKQGNNFRITHTDDIVPQLPWESVDKLLCPSCTPYYHISPEYHITSGLGNNPEKYKVYEGYANYSGNAASRFMPDIVAHIQYYQVNMYSCVLPIDSLVNIIGWPNQTKVVETDDFAMDRDWTLDELKDAGATKDELGRLTVQVPKSNS